MCTTPLRTTPSTTSPTISPSSSRDRGGGTTPRKTIGCHTESLLAFPTDNGCPSPFIYWLECVHVVALLADVTRSDCCLYSMSLHQFE